MLQTILFNFYIYLQIVVKHLQDQLKELQGAKEALAISRTREDALQKQVGVVLVFLMQETFFYSLKVILLIVCSQDFYL